MRSLAAFWLTTTFVLYGNAQVAADLVIVNASVQTLAQNRKKAEAIAVIGNKIAAVGTTSEIRKLVGEKTRVIDAGGKLVLPGFNDSHVHFMGIGNLFSALDLRSVETADEFYRRLGHYVRFLPRGRWILGGGGSDGLWKEVDGKRLSSLTPDNPVFVYNADAKSAIANSAAIKAGNVRNFPGPIVTGPQMDRIRFVVPADHAKNWPQIAETASNYAASFGITSVQDTDSDDHAAVYRELARQGRLKVRIYDCHGLPNWKKYADSGMKAATGDAMVRTGCLKGTADVDEKGQATLQRDVTAADQAGMQVLLHAIGPAMNKVALDVFENAAKTNGKRDRRFRIEHAERAASADVPRFGRLGVIASMQPHLFGWRSGESGHYRSMQSAGAGIAFGSDAPMTDLDPLLGISAVWKSGLMDDNLKPFIFGASYAEFQDDLKGTIEAGKLADLVVIDASKLKFLSIKTTTRVEMTVLSGDVVYER
jgi:Predicted metal-dependent hydrolase with the TIM-barrel fold